MASLSRKLGLASLVVVAATAYAVAQMPPGHSGMHGGADVQGATPQTNHDGSMHDRMMKMMQNQTGNMGQHGMMGMSDGVGRQPTMPGQDTFGAIQEVVQMLEADPKTDWSKVNIAALREHLIDMNEVTLHANATERPLDNGLEVVVTGNGRTLQAIKRMVPAHVSELVKLGWDAKTEEIPNGAKLTVTTSDAKQVTKLKALGFMGIMVQGAHHQMHHLMMAKGEHVH